MTLEIDDNLMVAFGVFVIVFFIIGLSIVSVDYVKKIINKYKTNKNEKRENIN